jgi:hypothetical protein
MSDTEGTWQRGWARSGRRLAVWHHYSGAVWAWSWDRKWLLAVRPIGKGKTVPMHKNEKLEHLVPTELFQWAKETA